MYRVYVFMAGFLLSRSALPDVSSCNRSPLINSTALETEPQSAKDGCWSPRAVDKIVIVIIDALRYDMVEYDHGLTEKNIPAYKNKLPVLDRMLMEEPQ
jgi:phosphatidylinositol glycan class O